MNLIVAVDENWGIGKDNKLLTHISGDLKRFQSLTTGKVVIMGRSTLESLPDGKPLPNRCNIVLTTDKNYKVEGAIVINAIDNAFITLINCMNPSDVFVIGGESIYRQLLKYCDTAYVTKIKKKYDADRFMVNLQEHPDWTPVNIVDKGSYQFWTYQKVSLY